MLVVVLLVCGRAWTSKFTVVDFTTLSAHKTPKDAHKFRKLPTKFSTVLWSKHKNAQKSTANFHFRWAFGCYGWAGCAEDGPILEFGGQIFSAIVDIMGITPKTPPSTAGGIPDMLWGSLPYAK